MTEHELLKVPEVADFLRVSTMTIYRLIESGDLPATRIGKDYRIRTSDLETFLEARYTGNGQSSTE